MLSCRAAAMQCAPRRWSDTLAAAKAWVPRGHPSASLLYIFDGASSDVFDETFRTWSPSSVGYGASPIVFGPQFASFKPRQLNRSLALIAAAVRRADACGAGGGTCVSTGTCACVRHARVHAGVRVRVRAACACACTCTRACACACTFACACTCARARAAPAEWAAAAQNPTGMVLIRSSFVVPGSGMATCRR